MTHDSSLEQHCLLFAQMVYFHDTVWLYTHTLRAPSRTDACRLTLVFMLYSEGKDYDVSRDSTEVYGVSAAWSRLLKLVDFYVD